MTQKHYKFTTEEELPTETLTYKRVVSEDIFGLHYPIIKSNKYKSFTKYVDWWPKFHNNFFISNTIMLYFAFLIYSMGILPTDMNELYSLLFYCIGILLGIKSVRKMGVFIENPEIHRINCNNALILSCCSALFLAMPTLLNL
jgi:ABC-type enterochelin transport system permease subunit